MVALTSVGHLDWAAVRERRRAVEARLGEIKAAGEEQDAEVAEERAALKRELVMLHKRVAETHEEMRGVPKPPTPEGIAEKRAQDRRLFAGLSSPLAEAMRERLSESVVAELEALALAKQDERASRAALRKAEKEAKQANGSTETGVSSVP